MALAWAGPTAPSRGPLAKAAQQRWQPAAAPRLCAAARDGCARGAPARAASGLQPHPPLAATALLGPGAVAAGVAAGVAARSRRSRRRGARSACQASGGESTVASEKGPKVLTAQQLVQRLFNRGKKSAFSQNAWYESPDTTTNGQARVWQHWQVRPTRTIERICDGKRSCGCTWRQLDGRRGVSFFRFDQDGRVAFVREVTELDGWRKFKSNNMESLKPVFGVMGTIQNVFGFASDYLSIDREPLRPRQGLAQPRTRRAPDVVSYLWDEAFCAEDNPVRRVMAEYSDAAVFEDLTYVEELWAKGKVAVQKYQEETKTNAPENLRFVLDEISDGTRSCTAVWHVEYGGQKSPRGVSFYELDETGKVAYVRSSYDLAF